MPGLRAPELSLNIPPQSHTPPAIGCLAIQSWRTTTISVLGIITPQPSRRVWRAAERKHASQFTPSPQEPSFSLCWDAVLHEARLLEPQYHTRTHRPGCDPITRRRVSSGTDAGTGQKETIMCSGGREPPAVQRGDKDQDHQGFLLPGGARDGRREDHQQALTLCRELAVDSGRCKDSGRTGVLHFELTVARGVQAAAAGVERLSGSIFATACLRARFSGLR